MYLQSRTTSTAATGRWRRSWPGWSRTGPAAWSPPPWTPCSSRRESPPWQRWAARRTRRRWRQHRGNVRRRRRRRDGREETEEEGDERGGPWNTDWHLKIIRQVEDGNINIWWTSVEISPNQNMRHLHYGWPTCSPPSWTSHSQSGWTQVHTATIFHISGTREGSNYGIYSSTAGTQKMPRTFPAVVPQLVQVAALLSYFFTPYFCTKVVNVVNLALHCTWWLQNSYTLNVPIWGVKHCRGACACVRHRQKIWSNKFVFFLFSEFRYGLKKASKNEENWPDLTKSRSEVRHQDYYLHNDKGEKSSKFRTNVIDGQLWTCCNNRQTSCSFNIRCKLSIARALLNISFAEYVG